MVAGCGNNVLKYILLFLNFLVFIMALAGFIASLVFILRPSTLDEVVSKIDEIGDLSDHLSGGTVKLGLYVILATSVIILIISFLGCCGAWKEIKFLLGLYSAILLLIVIVEVAAFVVAIVYKSKAEKEAKELLVEAKKKNETIFGDLEKYLKCCGADTVETCYDPKLKYKISCYDKLVEILKSFFTIVLAVSVLTVIIEVLLISFSCCLCTNIGENVA